MSPAEKHAILMDLGPDNMKKKIKMTEYVELNHKQVESSVILVDPR